MPGSEGPPRFAPRLDDTLIRFSSVLAFVALLGFLGLTLALSGFAPERVAQATGVFWFLIVSFGIIFVIFGMYVMVQRARVLVVRDRRPDAWVFLAQRTDELRDALPVKLPWSFAAAITDSGLELWNDDGTSKPAAVYPWTEITAVYPGRAVSTFGARPNDVNAVRLVFGATGSLPIGISGSARAGNRVLDAIARHVRVIPAP